MGMEFRPYYLSREWVKKGHKVRIIAADFSHLRKTNPVVKSDFEIENIDGIEYQWVRTARYESNGLSRARTMIEFCSKIYRRARDISDSFHPDVVISSSTYTFDTYPAQKIREISKCRYIHESHDLWPLTLIEIGGMSKYHPFVMALALAERSAYKNSDIIVSLFPNAYQHMMKNGMQNISKFKCIPNGIHLDDWNNLEAVDKEYEELYKGLKDSEKFIVTYVGGHAVPNALNYLIEAAFLSKNDANIVYVLVGNGMEKNHLQELALKYKLENVFFMDPISKKKIPSLLSMSDALYVGAERCNLYKYGVSMNKVYDYMMAAKPIIYGVEAANNDIDDFKCGITIEPENPKEIYNAIKRLMDMNSDERKEMGERGSKAVMENYNYEVLADRFLEVME